MKIRIELEPELAEEEIIIRCSKLDTNVQKIQQLLQDGITQNPKLSFFKKDKEFYLTLETILFFETSSNKIHAHTIDDVYEIRYRLYELEQMLPRNFLRVSKSTILNIDKILSINRNLTSSSMVEFYKSYKQVYVSRYYYKELKQRLDERRNYEI